MGRSRVGREGRSWLRLLPALPLGVLAGTLLLGLALLARLAVGPISLDRYAPRLGQLLELGLAEGVAARVGGAVLESNGWRPSVRLVDVDLRDARGAEILVARKVELGLNPIAWGANTSPLRAIRFLSPRLALTSDEHGAISWPGLAPTAASGVAAGGSTDVTVPNLLAGLIGVAERRGVTGGLRVVAVEDGTVTLDGPGGVRGLTAYGVRGAIDLAVAGCARATLSGTTQAGRDGPASAWSGLAEVGAGEGGHRVSAELRNLPLDHAALLVLPALAPDLAGAVLDAEANLLVGEHGQVLAGEGRIAGRLAARPDLPGGEAEATVLFDPAGTVTIREARVTVGAASLRAAGSATRDPVSGAWRGEVTRGAGELPPGRAGDPPLRVDGLTARLRVPADLSEVVLEQLDAKGPEFGVAAAGSFGAPGNPVALKLGLGGANASVAAALALWPPTVAPKLRAFVAKRLPAGRADRLALAISFSPSDLVEAVADRPIPAGSIAVELEVSDATLRFHDELPPLSEGRAVLRGDGRSVRVEIPSAAIDLGRGHRLDLSEGSFVLADASVPDPVGQVALRARGSVESALDLLGRPFLKPLVRLGELPAAKGEVDARLQLAVPLEERGDPGAVKVAARGTLSKLVLDRVAGNDGFDRGEIVFVSENGGLKAKGEGRLAGVPVTVEAIRPSAAMPAELKISGLIDEAARTRKGLQAAPYLTGVVGARATLRLAPGKPLGAAVELDLTRAGLDLPGLEVLKPAGRPGRATFSVRTDGDGVVVDELAVAAGDVRGAGQMRFGGDGALRSAELTGVNVPGGELAVSAERTRDGLKLGVRGARLDARPLLKRVLSGPKGGVPNTGPDVDLDLRIASATGSQGAVISGLEIKAERRGGALRGFSLAGRFGRAPLSGLVARDETGGRSLVVESADAGALLRFTDVYPRMVGGGLTLRIGADDRPDGLLTVRDFVLRGEPALASFANAVPLTARGGEGGETVGEIGFTKMRVDFLHRPGRFEITDGVMWGPMIGASVEGTLDLARDRAELVGTFVPAYGLNNLFSQIPVLGFVLGGGRNEGLFAVSFKVTGPIGKPEVSISPLSAIAPGFLRKLFEFRKEAGAGRAPVPPER